MYIRFFTQNNSVVYHDYEKPLAEEREFIDLNGKCAVAECDNIPNEFDYLEVANVQTKTDTWTEKEQVEKLDENGNPIFDEQDNVIIEEVEVEKSRTYLACDLVAKFRPAPTQEQIEKRQAKIRIQELKKLLEETDYQAIKYAEGWITEEEYAPIKTQRQAYREEINQLEKV